MHSFDKFGLSDDSLRSIEDLGFKTPSPIQQQSLPFLLGEPTDFIGLAATGTGKTAAFGLPLIEKIDATKKQVQGLILCPTRELALQVTEQINLLGKHRRIQALAVYGGASYINQIHGLAQGATIVVGTPGRVIDHMERGTLKLDGVHTIILDEADEMISMGFKDDLETILDARPKNRSHIWLFSATMSKEVRRVAETYLKNPAQVQVNKSEMLSNTVKQISYTVRESDKPEVLCKLIEAADNFYGLIFCQTKQLVTNLAQYLVQRGYQVDSLHGDKDQNARERTMQAFRNRKVSILVCTDVASRGLDVKDVTHVINYSIPRELDSYVHRIGRTARSGKNGIAMSLVSPSHRYLLDRIEKMTKSKIEEGQIPSRRDIGLKRISNLFSRFQDQKFHARVAELLNSEWKSAISEMDREEIVSRFIAILASDIFEDREGKTPPLDPSLTREERPDREEKSNRSKRRRQAPRRFHREKKLTRRR